ncbi:MAG: alcohol dehydrogenase catalytic domain-containing protein [Longimicrobiales bacterium]|nr:alcohol dehydrogenase catalytic domain-containing protein [Longimicrobiales bacterium]
MRALTFRAVEEVGVETLPDPTLEHPRDALVRVEFAGLCGSDLHPWSGREPGLDPGTVMGHEVVGEVVALGKEAGVRAPDESPPLEVGARVVAPFTTSCGACVACARGLTARCVAGELLGWRSGGRGLHGAQAEFVRIPLADTTLVRVPDSIADPALAILAGDILSTALFGAALAEIGEDDVVVIVGCGPVGLLSILAARAAGARSVVAVDRVPSRLTHAERFGGIGVALTPEGGIEAARAAVDELTAGWGADAAIEAVGSADATRTAAALLRPGARLAAVGVHTESHLALAPGEIYDRNLTYAAGRCSARHYLPAALDLTARTPESLASLISHRLPLSRGPDAYRSFAAREEGWMKVLFLP